MAHRPNWRAISKYRNYTVDEASRILGVAKGTVRRWIDRGELPVINGRKPTLILGPDLIALGERRKTAKQKCRLEQCYCMRCRAPKGAAFRQAEVLPFKGTGAMVRMLCETCTAVMHKRVSWSRLEALSALVSLSGPHRFEHLTDTAHPCVNVHLKEDD